MLMKVVPIVQDFIEKTFKSFDNLRQHLYISKAQASYLSKLKDELKDNEAIALLDFAENSSFEAQDVVQSFHWNNSQATLHPFVVYYKSKGELKHLNLCVISDCLKHDSLAVHAYINKGIPYIKEQRPFVTKLHSSVMDVEDSTKTIRICTMSVSASKTLELKQSGISLLHLMVQDLVMV